MKHRVFFASFLLALMLAPAFSFAADAATGLDPAAQASDAIESAWKKVEDFFEKNTPQFLKDSFANAYEGTEEVRLDLYRNLVSEKADTQAKIAKANDAARAGSATLRDKLWIILLDIEFFLTALAAAVFHSQALFYSVGALIVIGAVRFVFRKML